MCQQFVANIERNAAFLLKGKCFGFLKLTLEDFSFTIADNECIKSAPLKKTEGAKRRFKALDLTTRGKKF